MTADLVYRLAHVLHNVEAVVDDLVRRLLGTCLIVSLKYGSYMSMATARMRSS